MIADKIRELVEKILIHLDFPVENFVVEHPENIAHGDYSTNVAMVLAKSLKLNPVEVAEKIKAGLENEKTEFVESIQVVKPGFINFFLSKKFFNESLKKIIEEGDKFGRNDFLLNEKTVIEYTDPNPFKEFHIGHLMSNAIGESLSRIIEWNGAEVKRACYQGDVGMHVARAVAHKIKTASDWKNAQDVADSYAKGSALYESDSEFKDFTVEINKKIYSKEDSEVNEAYDLGRKLTLEHFERLYKILGTKFDYYFFESTTGEFGKALVHENTPKVFEESEGAIVYRGENKNKNLHTRVFINKDGLPTYEAKELGLAKIKFDTYPYNTSLVVTGNEIKDYFQVLLSAMAEIFPDLAKKTKHIPHGMLRLPTGKMSSRTGDIITAESLINDVKEKVREKIDSSEREVTDKEKLSEEVAIGAIKYSVLRQSPGKDIIFDFEKSLSFEGDSGPYLQYTHARANSILEKAENEGINPSVDENIVTPIEKLLYRFPEIVLRSYKELATQYIATYLIELCAEFNFWYAENIIVSKDETESAHRVAVTKAVSHIIKNGLYLLGISAPKRM